MLLPFYSDSSNGARVPFSPGPAELSVPAALAGLGQSTLTLLSAGFPAAQRHAGSHRTVSFRDSSLWMHPPCPARFKERLLSNHPRRAVWCKESPLLKHKLSQMERRAVALQRTCLVSGSHQGAQRQQIRSSIPSQEQSDALGSHKKFPGLCNVVTTVPQQNTVTGSP